ncbi:MAG: hypothetical protein KC492_35130 [Myxococcales bacterium]|nr:hypothetical protein [Myxococcales bacterium]
MDEKWKPWLIGLAVVLGVAGWLWWKNQNPTLLAGDYRCEGRVNHPDGTSSAIDGSAGVTSEGKIQIGQTGADLALGRKVMSWGDVKKTSRTEFLVELTPSPEVASEIPEAFWMTCSRR